MYVATAKYAEKMLRVYQIHAKTLGSTGESC